MKKRIKNKIEKRIWQSPIVLLKKYHCDECNQNLFLQVHKLDTEKILKYLENNKVLCPICKNELKQL